MTELKVTFLSAIGELHPNQQFFDEYGTHNGELTEDEFNTCYLEGDGVTEDAH